MRADWEDWGEGQIGISLEATPAELRRLAAAMEALSRSPDQHFHVSETGSRPSRVGDIEVSVLPADDDSMGVSSFAIAPGDEIVAARADGRGSAGTRWRPSAGAIVTILGFVLLFGGFAWIALNEFEVGVAGRLVIDTFEPQIAANPDSTLIRADHQAMTWIIAGARAATSYVPDFLSPGMTMLAGGLLLGLRRRAQTSKRSVL